MLKKTLIGAFTAAVLASLVLGWDTWSYLKTSVSSVRHAIKREVPLEFEIQRARNMVGQLDGEVRKCLHVIAEEEVNVESLKKELDSQVAQHDLQKEQILVQRKSLELKQATYTFGGKIYTVSDVQRDLADRFSRYQTVEETLASRRQVLAARDKSLVAARKKLDAMLDAKERLQVDIENLEAKMKTLDAAQVASSIEVDDSQVSQARRLISELSKRVEVEQKLLDGAGNLSGLIPIEVASEARPDVTAQIDSYFGGKTEVEGVAKTEAKLEVLPVSTASDTGK
ncbi:MAG: signal peptide-containing protein [Planctomycetaceae bacterium]|nr:signal peptide-containing protein [Planctomycetaceae bacterium]